MIPLSYTPIPGSEIAQLIAQKQASDHIQFVDEFEARVTQYTGAKYVVGTQSGSAALHLALLALGIGPGDYVLGPSFTYVATLMPVTYVGAIPVLIDCDPVSWNMDANLLESAIIDLARQQIHPKALIVVHNYGLPQDLTEIKYLCERHGILLLEDAAEAIGSSINGIHPGILGDLGILSFNANKILTTYGGGAVLCGDQQLCERINFLATQAREPGIIYEHREMGFNYKMGPLNAAAGIIGFNTLDQALEARRQSDRRYRQLLADFPVTFQETLQTGQISNKWLTCVVFEEEQELSTIQHYFRQSDIEIRRLWKPMDVQPYFSKFKRYSSGVGQELFARGISLPSTQQPEEVVDQLKSGLSKGYQPSS